MLWVLNRSASALLLSTTTYAFMEKKKYINIFWLKKVSYPEFLYFFKNIHNQFFFFFPALLAQVDVHLTVFVYFSSFGGSAGYASDW